jgi:hypothetical protein
MKKEAIITNRLGEDITNIFNLYNDADKLRLQYDDFEHNKNFHFWQNVFSIAMYQNIMAAWKYYDTYFENVKLV